MRQRTWKVIDHGKVPVDAMCVEYACTACGREASLPVVGLPLAQVGQGIVFDIGEYAMPDVIQCRGCGRVWATDAAVEARRVHVR